MKKSQMTVEEFVKLNVRDFCFYSNDSSLLDSAHNHPLSRITMGMGKYSIPFLGMGISKATREAVCLVCKEDDDLGDFYSAILQAKSEKIPLIFLSNFDTKAFCHTITSGDLLFGINEGVRLAKKKGPVNIRYDLMKMDPHTSPLPIKHHLETKSTISGNSLEELSDKIDKCESGVIIVGELCKSSSKFLEKLKKLSTKISWPLFLDIRSGMRRNDNFPIIPYYNNILSSKCYKQSPPTDFLHLGGRIISNRLREWLLHSKCYTISEKPSNESLSSENIKIEMDPEYFCDILLPKVSHKKVPQLWTPSLKKNSDISSALESINENVGGLTIFFGGNEASKFVDDNLFLTGNVTMLSTNSNKKILDKSIGIAKSIKRPLLVITTIKEELGQLLVMRSENLNISILLLQESTKDLLEVEVLYNNRYTRVSRKELPCALTHSFKLPKPVLIHLDE